MVDLNKAVIMCPSILSDGKKLKAVLSDLYTDFEDKQRINLLTILFDMGIVERIRLEIGDSMLIPKMVATATSMLPLDSMLTEWAVREWYNVLNIESYGVFYDPSEYEVDGATLVKYIGKGKNVIVPMGITKIKSSAFESNETVVSVTIPKSVIEIEDAAFSYCENLTKIHVDIENNGYYDIDGVLFNSKIKSLSYYPTGKSGLTYTIPQGIERISDYAFLSCCSIQSVILPDSILEIGSSAFSECENLKKIVIPDGVTIIEDYTFSCCINLESITIPNSVIEIGYEAFEKCSKLENIIFPNKLENIDVGAFSNCVALDNIVLPQSIKTISGFSFSNCVGLKSAFIPEGTVNVDEEAFDGCENAVIHYYGQNEPAWSRTDNYRVIFDATKFEIDGTVLRKYKGNPSRSYCSQVVTIPAGVTRIEREAFADQEAVKKIIVKKGLLSIGDGAFEMCISLENITLPDDVTAIGMGAFSDCRKLMTFSIPQKLKKIEDWCFSNCFSLERIDIPHGVTKVGNMAFSGCKNLSNIVIPSSVLQIGERAFEECKSLVSVSIPANVKKIGAEAFDNCTSLKEIHFAGARKKWATISDDLELPSRVKIIFDV